jgi:hypothetical protein
MRSGRRLLPLVFFTLCASLLAQSNPVLFAPVVTYESGGSYSFAVALGDVNGDGKPDVVVGSKCPIQSQCPYASGGPLGLISVLGGNGDGTFQSPVDYSSGGYTPESVRLADLNGDGHLDIVVVNLCQDDSYCAVHGEVSILLNNGDGTFHLTAQYDSAGQEAPSLAIGDLNGDGHPDLVVVNTNNVVVFINNGDGTFGTPGVYNSGGWGSGSVAIGDVNRDGHLDVVVSNVCYTYSIGCDDGTIGVLLNNGDGSFQAALSYPAGAEAPSAIAVADINADGKPDLIALSQCVLGSHYICSTSIVSVLLNNGDGTFKAPTIYGSGGWFPTSVGVADVNGDGKLDLVLTNGRATACCSGATAGWLAVLVGNGDGTFQTPQVYSSGGTGAMSIAIADVNGDGKPDLVAATCVASCAGTLDPGENPGSISVFINITPWPYKALVQPPINADASSIFKANRGVIPVKFTLTQNNAATCTLPAATIAVTRTAGGTLGSVDEGLYSMAADSGSNFRIDQTACQYVYNLAASALGVGTYGVDIKINGVVVGSAVFALK